MSNSTGMLRGMEVDAGAGYCTTELRKELDRAARLTHTLAALASRVTAREPVFVWLFGRDEEVRAVVGAILSDWSEGVIDAQVAAWRMRAYLDELEQSLDERFRRRAAARATTLASRRGSDTGAGVPADRSTAPALSDEAREAATS